MEREGDAMKRMRWGVVAAGIGLWAALALRPGPVLAEEEERGTWAAAGLGVGSILSNVLYMPAKFTYATLGAVTGGLAYLLTGGNYDVAQTVWVASLGGTYVITPNVLTGETPLEFWGTPDEGDGGGGGDGEIEEGPADGDRG
jgi:hypothetical protein